MAITNYARPQLTIAQLLAETATVTADRIIPLVIGPNYLLSRYGKEDAVYSETFATAGHELPYNYKVDAVDTALPSGYTPDQDSVQINGVGLEAQYAQFLASGSEFTIESLTEANVIRIATNTLAGAGTINSTFLGRKVKVGDIVYVYEDDVTSTYKKRVVTGFRGEAVAATKSDATNSAYNPATDATADSAVTVTAPTGWTITPSGTPDYNVRGGSVIGTKLSEEFTLTVRTGGAPATATVDITSKSGDFAATNVATVDSAGDYSITNTNAGGELGGNDIVLAHASDSLEQGQVFTVRIYQAYERLNDGNTDQITVAGTYTGTKDTNYLLTVKTGTAVGGDTADNAVLTITDSAGIDTASEVTVTNGAAFNVGTLGITATIAIDSNTVAQGGLRSGDTYVIACTAAGESTTNFDGVILDGPAVDTTVFTNPATNIKVQFREGYTGSILSTAAADDSAWHTDADSVDVDSGLALYMSDRSSGNEWVPFVDGVGALHLSFRALVPAPASEDRIAIESVSDITENLGTIDLDNDLAFGVSEALSGVQGLKRVYALRTAGTTLADFTAALAKIESTDSFYTIGVLSDDLTIQQAVASHCESMSAKDKKNFRRCYVGTDSPGEYVVLDVKPDTTSYTATISDNGGTNTLLTTADDVDFTTLGLETGDLVKLTASGDEYEIQDIISATEIELKTGPVAPVSPAVPFQLWRADTASSQSDYIVNISKALSSRRCANVWVQNGKRLIDGTLTAIPNRFVACEVAGLRCAVLPQQGLTNTEIQSVTSAPEMYVKFTQDQLDTIAKNGTWVITQEAESGEVFIRHQLTTESDLGSLYYEDSVGVNLDNISFTFKDTLRGYIGKKNVTQKTLEQIKRDAAEILGGLTKVPANALYGPSLNGFENLVVAAHPTLKDRITLNAKLLMPLPLNNIDVELEADVDLSL